MNEKYSFILNRKNIKEGKIYIVEYSSTKKSLKIFPEKKPDKFFELETDELKLPMFVTEVSIFEEIGSQIKNHFEKKEIKENEVKEGKVKESKVKESKVKESKVKESEMLILRCNPETKDAINRLAASNSLIFE